MTSSASGTAEQAVRDGEQAGTLRLKRLVMIHLSTLHLPRFTVALDAHPIRTCACLAHLFDAPGGENVTGFPGPLLGWAGSSQTRPVS